MRSCLHQNRLTVFGVARLTSAGGRRGAPIGHGLGGGVRGTPSVHLALPELDVAADGVRHHGGDGAAVAALECLGNGG